MERVCTVCVALLLVAGLQAETYLDVYPPVNDSDPSATPLYFGLLQSFGTNFNGSGSIAGVRVALDLINSDATLLPGYSLHYTLTDSQCNRTDALGAFFPQVIEEPLKVAIVGSGCSLATEPTAEVSRYYNLTQISCVSSSPSLSDRVRFRYYFQLLPSEAAIAPAYYGVVKYFGWRRVALIVQNENLFTVTMNQLKDLLEADQIQYSEEIFETSDSISTLERNLFDEDARIYLIETFAVHARPLLCEAYHRGLKYPRYLLLTPAWYEAGWWLEEDDGLSCTAEQRTSVLPSSLAFVHFDFLEDVNMTTDTGIAVESLQESSSTAVVASGASGSTTRREVSVGIASGASGSTTRPEVRNERNKLFNFGYRKRSLGTSSRGAKPPKSKKKRLNTWMHDFVCLSSKSAAKPPSPFAAGELLRGGLGRKQLILFPGDQAMELHAEIINAFPMLKDGGGYDLLRLGDGTDRNTLCVIPQPSQGYNVSYLKEVVRQAKIYIRPIQHDLELLPEVTDSSNSECPREECALCNSKIPLPQLRQHLECCRGTVCRGPEDDSDDGSVSSVEVIDVDKHDQAVTAECSGFALAQMQSDIAATEDAIVTQAVIGSLSATEVTAPETSDSQSTDRSPQNLKEAIQKLEMKLSSEHHEYHIRRNDVFCDILRETRKRSYNPFKRVKTYFVGESGQDTGGLTRELWRLFGKFLQENLCDGKENCVLRHDSTKLQEGLFRKVGMLMGISIVQGGSGYPFFAPSTFSYLCGNDLPSIAVGRNEIADSNVEHMLQEITAAGADDAKLREVAMTSCDVLLSCGFTKPIPALTHRDVPRIIECVCLHSALLQVKAELDEIAKGIADAGVLEMLQKHPDLFRPLFVYSPDPLTAETLMALFGNRAFSEKGSNEHVREQATYMLFSDLLEELEGGIEVIGEDGTVGLSDCLSFFTGASRVPPVGFDTVCTLNFSPHNMYPTASTCALILTLPTMYHDQYSTFKDNMVFAFRNHGGFGLC